MKLVNLPDEILEQPRFFKVSENKIPLTKAWSNPSNQQLYHKIKGTAGFDTCGHDRAADYLFLDFDHVIDDNEIFVNDDAERWFNFCATAETYCEKTISGHGFHFIFKPTAGKFSPVSNGKNGVLHFGGNAKLEIFYKNKARYCLFTGNVFNCNPKTPIVAGDAADEILQTLLDEIARRNLAQANNANSTTKISKQNSAELGSNYDLWRAIKMLDCIVPDQLDDTDWLVVLSACKNVGIDYSTVDAWCRRDNSNNADGKPRYNEKMNLYRWNSLNDSNFGMGHLYNVAAKFAYSEKDAQREYFQLHPELSKKNLAHAQISDSDKKLAEKIEKWQKVRGQINPDILEQLKAAVDEFNSLTVTAEIANDDYYRNLLGMFRFYSFFSTVADKFFADLKNAKANAKRKNSAYKKSVADARKYTEQTGINTAPNDNLKPTDDELALVSLNVNKLDDKIDSFCTKAKKKHAAYLAQLECDRLNALEQAKHEEYENNKPSTKLFVKDCPVDLILPEGVYFTEDGIKMIDFDEKATQRSSKEVTQTPILPTRRYADPKADTVYYEISIRDTKRKGKWRKTIIEGSVLQEPRSITILGNYGALISNPKLLVKFFNKIIGLLDNADRLPECKFYDQPGWTDDTFTEFIFPPGDRENYFVNGFNFDYDSAFSQRGDFDKWLNMYNQVASTSITSRLTIGAALSAPLVRVFNMTRNFQLHLSSPSGSGKSAIAKFALSIFGHPDSMKFTFNGTANSLDTQAAIFNDLPSYIDELQAANKKVRENIDTVIYNYSEGVNKSRNQKINALQKRTRFRGTRLTTGEQNLTNDFSGEGAISRILEISRKDIMNEKFAVQVHQFSNQNYGFLGQKWINFISENQDAIIDKFNRLVEFFGDNSGLFRAHAIMLAAFYSAFVFFNKMLGFDAQKIEAQCIDDFLNLLENGDLRTKDASTNVARAASKVQEFANAYPNSFYLVNESTNELVLPNHASNEIYGIRFRNGAIGFFPSALKKIVLADFPNAEAVVRAFADNNYIKSTSQLPNHLYQTCARFKEKRFWIYKFQKDFDEELNANE